MDELQITALGIGHGDAILLQWKNQNSIWTCLIDGGPSPQDLIKHLDEIGVKEIDLLVLTHLDSDHIGGLVNLTQKKRIGSFWGPALPAFSRHLWMFGQRGAEAIKRGAELEESLIRAKVDICYPLEGYASSPFPHAGKISVMSPPPKLLRRLLTEDDISTLFSQEPMPLGWLVEVEPEIPKEETPFLINLDAALTRNFLTGENLEGLPPPLRHRLTKEELEHEWLAKEALVREWMNKTQQEPEFFGDSVLNNTSLVLYLEAYTEKRLHRALFAGDQENWTYLLARNPRGLQTDLFKASHHGGRVYLESELAYNELLSSIQPRIILLSANGQHHLPRNEMRQAAIRWGASVICTSQRRLEIISGDAGNEICCHALNQCVSSQSVKLIFDEDGIRSKSPACYSGFGRNLGPIIQVRQHIVEPSPVVSHLFEHELRRHMKWVKEKLAQIHHNRINATQKLSEGSTPVSEKDLSALAREEGRGVLVVHLSEVLTKGMEHGEFWAVQTDRYYRGTWHAYTLPNMSEITNLLSLLSKKVMLLFPTGPGPAVRDPDSIVNGLEIHGLAAFTDCHLHFPSIAFRDILWPEVARELKKSWHCFLHRSGMIAFSTKEDIDDLLTSLIAKFRVLNYLGDYIINIDREKLPFSSPVLASGKDNEGKPINDWQICKTIKCWFDIYKKYCDPEDWDQLCERLNERSWANEMVSSEKLCETGKGDVSYIVKILAPMVEKLW